jgi:alkylation response protein AidB-like acyl-CoA dehydrogenase
MAEVPEELGGLDLSVLAVTAMCSTPADFGGLSQMVYGHQGIGMLPIVNFGTPDQIERYLGPCMEGEMLSAFALTEPGSGSDAMNIQTRAMLDESGTHYVLHGAKQWITNAGWADLFVLFAKVEGEHFTAFLVERETPGLEVGEPEHLLGHDGSMVNAVTLEGVRVPVGNVLGEVGRGHKVAFCTLNMGRLKLAASGATGAKAALRAAALYAAERVQFGRPIADFGLIKRKLAEMAARAYAADAVSYRTAGLVYEALESLRARGDTRPEARLAALAEFSVECSLAKVFGSEAYNANADEALQVFGGYGFSEEYPPARMYRDARISRIYEGTNEINRLFAQRRIFKRLEGEGATRPAQSYSESVAALKELYLDLADETLGAAGPDGLDDPERQQLLASLADIAMQIYTAETTALRVAKLAGRGTAAEQSLREDLSALVLHGAAGRIHAEASALLVELHAGSALGERLRQMASALPARLPAVAVRNRISDAVVASRGMLPGD